MEDELGQDSTSKQDAMIVTEDDSSPSENEETEVNPFDELIHLILELDPGKYGKPFSDIELQKMRDIISAGKNKFPKKVLPYIELMRKFLFANYQLIALAALAHQTAQAKSEEEETLVKPATFSDLGKLEAEKMRND
jgi:hypothetical protein